MRGQTDDANASDTPPARPAGDGDYRRARLLAIVTGFLGALLAVATPLLPVRVDTAQLNWPENNTLTSVTAPLVGYVPTDMTISIPCAAARGLEGHATVLLSTVPKQAPSAVDRGMLIQRSAGDLVVIVRNRPIVTAPMTEVLGPDCQRLEIIAHSDKVTGRFVGLTQGPRDAKPGQPRAGEQSGYDFRPQIVGVFTDLNGPAPDGLIPLDIWFKDLFPAAAKHGGLLVRAAMDASTLLPAQQEIMPLHADLHHDNVLDFEERGWLAIDPKSVIGDCAFEYTILFCDPDLADPEPPVATLPGRFERRLEIVLAKSGLERERLLKWILAWCGLSAVWFLGDDDPLAEINLSVAEHAIVALDAG